MGAYCLHFEYKCLINEGDISMNRHTRADINTTQEDGVESNTKSVLTATSLELQAGTLTQPQLHATRAPCDCASNIASHSTSKATLAINQRMNNPLTS